MAIWESLRAFFTKGHERSIRAKKNILGSLVLKGVSICTSFILIPLTIAYLNPTKYGIWVTLSSVVWWITFFDVGLGNGLRNKFAEAKAKNNTHLARVYVSTTYALVIAVISVVYLLFLLVYEWVDWAAILNVGNDLADEVNRLIFIVFTVYALQFIVRLLNMVLTGDQRPAAVSLINTLGNLVALVSIWILTKTSDDSLLLAGTCICMANLIVPVLASFYVYGGMYKKYRPSLSLVKLKYAKDLFGLGIQFFILQIAAIIVFTTDNLIITQVMGPEEVTPYNIAFKYFSIITILFTIVTTPFWSAYTEAYEKGDNKWIKHTLKRLLKLWLWIVLATLVLLALAEPVYQLWIGKEVKSGSIVIPFTLSLGMAIWVVMASFTTIFGNFVSGVSRVKLSLYIAVFASIVNIPLSIFLAGPCGMGSAGVIAATCLGTLPQIVIQPIQVYKIVKGTAKGIWNQ